MIDRGPADAVRARLADPRDVARRLGFDRIDRQRGDGVLVCCPAHAERTPSCSLTRSGGTLRAKCHACGWGGDVLTLIASVRGLDMKRDFPAIVAEGASLARLPAHLSSLSPAPPLPPTPITDDLFAVVVARLLGLCPLRYSPDVCAYLDGRGIADEAARDGWGALRGASEQRRVCSRLVAEFGRQAMVASGLCVQDNEGWVSISRPASRLLIPWRDAGGRIIGLQRRRIDAGEPRYVATAGRPLREPYGLERLAQSPRAAVVWVEGAVDVLALRVLRVVGVGGGFDIEERHDGHGRALCMGESVKRGHIGINPRLCKDGRDGQAEQERGDRIHSSTIAHPRPLPPPFIALALPGVEGWRSAWAAYTRGRDVYVAADADDAGDRVAVTIDRDCRAAGARSVQRMRPPAKDWCAVLEERRKA